MRLCRFFGLSDGFWLRAQAAFDIEVAQRELAVELTKIKPWAGTAARTRMHAQGVQKLVRDELV